MANLPVILVVGVKAIELRSEGPSLAFETRNLDCRCYEDDSNLMEVLAKERPAFIASIGSSPSQFPNLCAAPDFIKGMWMHFPDTTPLEIVGKEVFAGYLKNMLSGACPRISVVTPVYKSGDKILRPYHSMLSQTYPNWEWIVIDDSDDDGQTFNLISQLAQRDPRIRVYKEHRRSGVIGHVKRTGFDLSHGEFLVELDHDDRLVPECLEWIVSGYDSHPEVGFIYSDFAECFEDGGKFEYPDNWGFGYGSYRTETHNGMEYSVVNSPRINPKTIRHIVAAPNHVRSWRANVYRAIGGHNPSLHVADDYELMVRTFLATRMGHIPRMAYVQYRNMDGNTHQVRGLEIQRLVRGISLSYDRRIHDRFVELGVDDFVWDPEGKSPSFYRLTVPNPREESHCTVDVMRNW